MTSFLVKFAECGKCTQDKNFPLTRIIEKVGWPQRFYRFIYRVPVPRIIFHGVLNMSVVKNHASTKLSRLCVEMLQHLFTKRNIPLDHSISVLNIFMGRFLRRKCIKHVRAAMVFLVYYQRTPRTKN